MADCLFCRIAEGEIPASVVFQNERLVAFQDINPQAPLHVLVIPRRHISTVNDLTAADQDVLGELIARAAAIAQERGYSDSGYRVVLNCNRDAGQTVFHIHAHVLAGRPMAWPPG